MKGIKYAICSLLIVIFQISTFGDSGIISADESLQIVNKLNSKKSELIQDAIKAIEKKPDISLNHDIREQLVKLAVLDESYYSEIMSVLKKTRD